MNRRRFIIGLAIAVSVIVVGTGLSRIGGHEPRVPHFEARSQPFRLRVTAEGTLTSVRSTPLTAPIQPQVPFTLSWLVNDGAMVDEGEIIARFDDSRLVKDHEDGVSDQKISDHRIHGAQSSREATVGKLERDAEVAQHELGVAREFQSTDNLIYSKIEIAESQIDTELAETRAEHAQESREIQESLSDAEIDLLVIERRKADLKVQQAREGLTALEVRSPGAGLVILERDWRGNPVRVGDTVWPGRPLGEIPDLTEMQAEVFVLEADAGDLAVDKLATVWLESRPGVAYPAVIKSVDPMAGRKNRRVPVQYFRTILAIDETDQKVMKYGTRVHAEITIADFDACLTVPRQAVATVDGINVVYRWEKGRYNPVAVELGPSAVGRVVVTSGIEEGDLIALRDPSAATDSENESDENTSPMLTGGGS